MKPLLVGDQPTRDSDRYYTQPLGGVFARKLCRITGLSGPSSRNDLAGWTALLYEHFDCVNVIQRNKPWDETEAMRSMSGLIEPSREVVVLLGRRVQQAYIDMHFPGESPLDDAVFYEWILDAFSPTGRRHLVVLTAPKGIMEAGSYSRRTIQKKLNQAIEKAGHLQESAL